MKASRIITNLSACLVLVMLISCIEAPLEIDFNTEIKPNKGDFKNQIQNLQREITQQLYASQKICVDAFSHWLEQQFILSRIPKRIISPLEYGAHDSRLSICPSFDLEKEIPKAWKKLIQTHKIKLDRPIFNIKNIGDKFDKISCLKKLINQEKSKLTITNIKTKIITNTLNFDIPTYNIYLITKDLDLEEIKKNQTEKELLNQGALKLLGTTKAIKAGFVGLQNFDFVKNPALNILEKLRNNLVAFPQNTESMQKNRDYYVIPDGEAEIIIKLEISVNLNFSDISCILNINI
jgi:hypothetical protein